MNVQDNDHHRVSNIWIMISWFKKKIYPEEQKIYKCDDCTN